MDYSCYRGKRILITGHTGFKGSWLALWLEMLGAEVTGYSLNPPTIPNHISCINLRGDSIIGDVRDFEKLKKIVQSIEPSVVFHLAAQPLVRYSYEYPLETFDTNIMGTVNILEACRTLESLEGIVIVTSDKCYASNTSKRKGYKEDDRLGGDDPYSCSKSCAELITTSYRRSYFRKPPAPEGQSVLASVRAGNVIGGGDWGKDRLLPDIVNAIVKGKPIVLRNPQSVRPWQHVLDALSGYILIGKNLLEGKPVGSAWNFGPEQIATITVIKLVELVGAVWEKDIKIRQEPSFLKEADFLSLDISKAKELLGWQPIWDAAESVRRTVDWYKAYYDQGSIITENQIFDYMAQTNGS